MLDKMETKFSIPLILIEENLWFQFVSKLNADHLWMCGTNGVCGHVVVRLVVSLGTLDLHLESPGLCIDFSNWN